MNPSERDAVIRARLRSLASRAQSIEAVLSILRGQIAAQERELAVSLELMSPAQPVPAAPAQAPVYIR